MWLLSTIRCTFIVLVTLMASTTSIEWLSISSDEKTSWNSSADCARTAAHLHKEQRLVCERHVELMTSVVQASREVIDVCQALFADKRWNCSSVLLAPNYLPDLTGGSREQAFLYALASAAVTHSVAKACSTGRSAKCNCAAPVEAPPASASVLTSILDRQGTSTDVDGTTVKAQFKWGGCGDDVRFGVIFSTWFTDDPLTENRNKNRRKLSKSFLMNLQNNGVGRTILRDSLTSTCKCHGVSGSCTLKTCYKVLPSLRVIGESLLRRYTVAVEVTRRPTTKSRGPHTAAEESSETDTAVTSQKRKRKYAPIESSSGSQRYDVATMTSSKQKHDSRMTQSRRSGREQMSFLTSERAVVTSQRGAVADVAHAQTRRSVSREQLVSVMTSENVAPDELIYYTISPDYCLPDTSLGSYGTQDRLCDKDHIGSGGCRSMCCGRGYTTEMEEKRFRCDCRYYWCCYVKCKTCTKIVQTHRCR